MDFIITFRTDLFIKVYRRILSADYTVLSILPSANPLNEWDGFSVIGGNGLVYEALGISKHFTVKPQRCLLYVFIFISTTYCPMIYTHCCAFVLYFSSSVRWRESSLQPQ